MPIKQSIQVHPLLKSILEKHFMAEKLPKLVEIAPEDLNRATFRDYWVEKLSMNHRQQASCFAMPELVSVVNTVNSRLLYKDLVRNIFKQQKAGGNAQLADAKSGETDEEDYKLLSIFEMLWNVFKPGSKQDNKKEKVAKEEKPAGADKMLGHAMTIKDEYLTQGDVGFLNLMAICEQVRKPATFLCETLVRPAEVEGGKQENLFPLQVVADDGTI